MSFFRPKTPDECTRNLLYVAILMFFTNVFVAMHAYRETTITEVIAFLGGLNFIYLAGLFYFYHLYHYVKGTSVQPIKNFMRDLHDVKRMLKKDPENEEYKEKLEDLAEKLAIQMRSFVERKDQFLYLYTYNYDGIIGTVGSVFDGKNVYVAEMKGRSVIPKAKLDLTSLDYVERVSDEEVSSFTHRIDTGEMKTYVKQKMSVK